MSTMPEYYLYAAQDLLEVKGRYMPPEEIAEAAMNSRFGNQRFANIFLLMMNYYKALYENKCREQTNAPYPSVARDCIMAEYNAKKGSAA